MINPAGCIAFIEKNGGTDVYPQGIVDLDVGDPTLALYCSAGSVGVLHSHYVWRYAQEHLDRVTADSGTTASTSHVSSLLFGLRGEYDGMSLLVPCASGKAGTLYSVVTEQDNSLVGNVVVVSNGTATSNYIITTAPQLNITSVTNSNIVVNSNPKTGLMIRLYESNVVAGGFGTYAFKQNITTENTTINYADTFAVNRKYKAIYRHELDSNVSGPQSGIKIVVGYTL